MIEVNKKFKCHLKSDNGKNTTISFNPIKEIKSEGSESDLDADYEMDYKNSSRIILEIQSGSDDAIFFKPLTLYNFSITEIEGNILIK